MKTGLETLSDEAIDSALDEAVRQERLGTAQVLRCLIEFSRRRRHERKAFPSLFEYCTSRLGYDEQAAYKRTRAAKTASRFPEILDLLEQKRIDLSRIVIIGPHLTENNCAELLARACAMSKRDLEFFAAGLRPKPVPGDTVRSYGIAQTALAPDIPREDAPAPLPECPSGVRALTESLARVSFTADRETLADIERARALLRLGKGSLGPVIARALKSLLQEIDPTLQPEETTPRRNRASNPRARRIPRWIRRKVWKRDGGQCAFRDDAGNRCCGREKLQFDHVKPWAAGGRSDDPDNIRLLCPLHNQAEARRWFGDSAIERAIDAKKGIPRESAKRLENPQGHGILMTIDSTG